VSETANLQQLEVLSLAERGWRLLPCAERGKQPLISDWRRRASSDPEAILSWARRHPRCNWGLACGAESGIWVLDIDGESGTENLQDLLEQHGTQWTQTITAQTGNGMHFYFAYPTEASIRNSASKLAAGLDTRGDGGYCIVPPSIHPTGATYRWTAPLNGRMPASTPEWLLHLVAGPQRPAVRAQDIGAIYEGQRNDTLFRTACYLRRKGAELNEITAKLFEQNATRCRPPLADEDIQKIARQAAAYPVGGLDPLESAWREVQGELHSSKYERFIALARALQASRPDKTIALPVKRVSALLDLHYTMISIYRTRAVKAGVLELVEPYVKLQRKAACYRFLGKIGEKRERFGSAIHRGSPNANPLPRLSLLHTNGLVRAHSENPHSESRAVSYSESPVPYSENLRYCYVHRIETPHWKRIDSSSICQFCHPKPYSEVN
jgi:hypothetical protein